MTTGAVEALPLPPLEPLEIHSGMVVGSHRGPLPEPEEPLRAAGVREALEELLLAGLGHPPCLVAFSGGRDSSALLALAADVARRHGLADPVPITLRYGDHPRTWESDWQETMIRHVGLADWQILEIRSELDVLGPIAAPALLRHGQYWPGNAHATIPLLRAARGGSLVTGNGGDESFAALLARGKPTVRGALRGLPLRQALVFVPLLLLPVRLRTRITFSRGLRLPWLRRRARREVLRRFLAGAGQPGRDARGELEKLHRSRLLELGRAAQAAFSAAAGVRLVEPFLDPRFFEVVAAQVPPGGFPSRTAALEAFFGELLPPEVAGRTTKATFTETLWGPQSRGFAARWDGTGLDPHLVDAEALRRVWSRPRPDLRSVTPLQAAWLATEGPR